METESMGMSTTASLNSMEAHLAELAGRLVRQEETTRRLEATLKASGMPVTVLNPDLRKVYELTK